MSGTRTWRWMPAAMLLAMGGMTVAGGLEITSFNPGEGKVGFKTSDAGTSNHNYRVEASTSLVSAAWAVQATVGGVGASASVTSPVSANASAEFYRVVATLESAVFVDGPYMAIDISGGTGAVSYPVTYYRAQAVVAGGTKSVIYKTTNILMRLIPKGTFTMGSPVGELGRDTNETHHAVTLTENFYIGVFEVTQRQWELVMGNKPSFYNASQYATRPVEQVSYYDIREDLANSEIVPHWPQSSQVHEDSFMGKLRAKTGLAGFDLPTESQWEYACRAGTTRALHSGYNLTKTTYDSRMDAVGRYMFNGGGPEGSTSLVGSYQPNAWGLYDMHGNVWEWCLDWHGTYPGTVSNPAGSDSASFRVFRGGCWKDNADYCRAAMRASYYPDTRDNRFGFRACYVPSGQQ